MRSVIAKEIRGLTPFIWLIVFLTLSGYLAGTFTESLMSQDVREFYGDGLIHLDFEVTLIFFFIAMTLSYGLLVREVDDRTVEFLDSLPISRTGIFAAKWIAAMGVLLLLPLLDGAVMLAIRFATRDSLDPSLHLDWMATSMFFQSVQIFTFFSIGLTLSFFRRFGWLIVGLFGWAMMVLGNFNPSWDLVNLPLFAEVQFVGTRWLIPWSKVVAYLFVGVVSSVIACVLFNYSGTHSLLHKRSPSRLQQAVMLATSFVIGIVFIGAITFATFQYVDLDEDNYDQVRENFPSWSTATRKTEHFTAVYPTNMAGRADELLDQADSIYDQVAAYLGADEQPEVQLNLASVSSHMLGNANWNSINMDITVDVEKSPLRSTLGHEMTHVVLESLADNQLRENFASTRFFHEGTATYLERRLFTGDGLTDEQMVDKRIGPAVLVDRKEASLERLIDDERLRQEADSLQVYGLGEVFAAAVADRFGDEALGKVARMFSERRHSEGLSGAALWRSIFQAAGYSFSEAENRYYELLNQAKTRHAELVRQLPPLYPIVDVDKARISFRFDADPPPDYQIVVRFRSTAESRDDQYWSDGVDEGVAVTSRDRFATPTIWYQVGYRSENELTIFQPWEKFVAR